jgi:hypothetical protein
MRKTLTKESEFVSSNFSPENSVFRTYNNS